MSIYDTELIDKAFVNRDGTRLILIMADELGWDDQELHFNLLEKKIGRYLNFVDGGTIQQHIPEANNLPVTIDIRFKHDLTANAISFLSAAQQQLDEQNIKLTYGMVHAHS